MPDEKGETRRQRNARFGQPAPEIECPDGGEHLVEWFWDLHLARSAGINGPNPLSFPDIASWSGLTGTIVRREELGILRRMDAAYLTAVSEEHRAAAERQKKSP